jgi:hypothetical protein
MTDQRPLERLSQSELKIALKEGLKEWLDEQVTKFGWFALKTIGSALFAAVIGFIIWTKTIR